LTYSSRRSVLKGSSLIEFGYPVSKESEQPTSTEQHELSIKEPEWVGFEHQNHNMPAREIKDEKCGVWMYRGCLRTSKHPDKKAYVERYRYSCNKASCEECFPRWRDREAEAIRDRIERGRKKLHQLPIHVIISVPTWEYDKSIKDTKKKATVLLKRVGMSSFSVIFHPARFNQRDGKMIPFVSPHFHVLGFGWISKTKDVYKELGYVIKNLGVRKTQGEVFATARYELSHVGIRKHHHAVTWHGELSYAKLGSPKKEKIHVCPHCNSKMRALVYTLPSIKLDEPPPPDDEWKLLRYAAGYEIVTTNYRKHHD